MQDYNQLEDIVGKSLEGKIGAYWVRHFREGVFLKEAFLFVLGLYQEAKTKLTGRLAFVYSEPWEREFYENLFDDVFGYLPSDLPRPSKRNPLQRALMFSSKQVMEVIDKLTNSNTSAPHSLLCDQEKIVEYLRGFLHRSATVTYTQKTMESTKTQKKWPRVQLRAFTHKGNLGNDIVTLLGKLGIQANYNQGRLLIDNFGSLKSLIDFCLLRPSTKSKLENILNEVRRYWNSAVPVSDEFLSYGLRRDIKEQLLRNKYLLNSSESKGCFYPNA